MLTRKDRFIPCQVTAYSGYRGDERPSAIVVAGRTVEIVRMRTMRIEEHIDSRVRTRIFDALGNDGQVYTLRHTSNSDDWTVRIA
jgi:hypothetical protein